MCQARNFSPGYFLNVISHWPRDFSTCRKCRRWGSSPRCLVGSTEHTMPLLCPLCEGKRGGAHLASPLLEPGWPRTHCLPDASNWKGKLCPWRWRGRRGYALSAQPPPLMRPLCLLYILLDLEPGHENADSEKRETWRASAPSNPKWLQLLSAFPFLSAPSALSFSEKERRELQIWDLHPEIQDYFRVLHDLNPVLLLGIRVFLLMFNVEREHSPNQLALPSSHRHQQLCVNK